MKLVMIRGFCCAGFGSVSALGLRCQMERTGCFTAMLVTPAKMRLGGSMIRFEGTTEISLETLWRWKKKECRRVNERTDQMTDPGIWG